MKENELKGMDEVLVHDVGETEPEFTGDLKKKKITRVIIIAVALILIVAIVVTLILLLKKDDDDDEKDETTILMENEEFNKPKNTNKEYQLIQLKKSGYKFILVHDPYTTNGGLEIKTNLGFNT